MFQTATRRLAALSRPLFRNNVYSIRSGLAAGLKRRGGLGFLPRSISREEEFLLSLDLSGQVIYDVGAYEGIFTIFFARACGPSGAVYAWEPNPGNILQVEENVRLNGFGHVRAFQAGIGEDAGTVVLTFDKHKPARGSLAPDIAERVGEEPGAVRVNVRVDSLDHQVEEHKLPPPNLVKLDVEGLEMPALRGMVQTLRQHRPAVYIENHGSTVSVKEANVAAVTAFLRDLGYRIRHVESDTEIGRENSSTAREGHIYCVWGGS